ncbi:MAG: helix-turn-helix transcriptional regulator [Sedimentisphaerales bacterium]
MSIGKGIKFVRAASGLRQGEMAKRLKISQNYLSLIENNKAEPSLTLIKKISVTFGVPASFLFWEDNMAAEGNSPQVTELYERIRSLVHELQRLRISRRSASI